MKSSKWIRIALMMTVVLPLAVTQTAPPPQTVLPVGSALVTEVKGDVVFTSPQGTPIVAQRGSTLTAESKIETAKGKVLLELQDGSQVLVNSHSNVVLKAPNEGKGYFLDLFLGKIMVKVQKRLGTAPSFRMGTPSAVITVRGTRFQVVVDKKHKTFVDVFEGLVDVAGIMEGSPHILIKPGFSTRVPEDRAPEEPREIGPGEGMERENQGGAERNTDDQLRQPRQGTEPRQGTQTEGSDSKPD